MSNRNSNNIKKAFNPNKRQYSEQPECISNTRVVEKVVSHVIPDSPDMCNNDIQTDQNAEECDDERAALANLITNLTLDTEENKKILKQLNCLIALQSKQTELEMFKTFNDRTIDYDEFEVIHRTSVRRPQLRSTQMKDKVAPNNSQVKFKKSKVEDHHRISSISNETKSVTASNDILKSKTLNVNVVCVACVSEFLNDVIARTKKPKVGTISTRQPKS
uniref:Integrase, catalytic region, zinc finger, CCHC-type, peptidase aspartic, catalytic n=1 Tax=Tanacetum cinerariifolium TaxID=118510 RepID=A0A699HQB2_TANCI|nr:hypothetical protein [Tanacetum cinerariifolium]